MDQNPIQFSPQCIHNTVQRGSIICEALLHSYLTLMEEPSIHLAKIISFRVPSLIKQGLLAQLSTRLQLRKTEPPTVRKNKLKTITKSNNKISI